MKKNINGKAIIVFLFYTLFVVAHGSNFIYAQTIIDTIKLRPESGNGVNPVAIAVDPNSNRIYIANEASNNVSVIDGETNEVVDTVVVGQSPRGIAVNTSTNRVYVANSADNNVNIISATTNQVVNTAPVGISPQCIGINTASNKIYVANKDSDNISVIDGFTNMTVATVTVNVAPNGIAVNDVGNLIYVANEGSNNVSVIDGINNKVIDTISVGLSPGSIGINTITNRIYVSSSNEKGNEIVEVIDGDSQKVIDFITFEGKDEFSFVNILEIGINSNANHIYVARDETNFFDSPRDFITAGFFNIIDGNNNEIIAETEVGNTPAGIGVNPATNTIYVANNGNNNVNIINGRTNTVIETVTLGRLPFGICVNQKENRIYIINKDSGDISVIDSLSNEPITTINPVSLSPATPMPRGIGVNSATNLIYVANDESREVNVIDGITNSIISTINVGCEPSEISINSKDNLIYVQHLSGGFGKRNCSTIPSIAVIDGFRNSVIFNIELNTDNEENPIDNMPEFSGGVAFNPGNNRIYATSDFNQKVNVINSELNSLIDIIELDAGTGRVAVNPNTNRVFVIAGSGINVIDSSANKVIDTITLEGNLVDIEVNIDLNHIYVTDSSSGSVRFIDGFTHKVIATVEVGNNPRGMAVDQVNNLLYVTIMSSGEIKTVHDDFKASPAPPATKNSLMVSPAIASKSVRLKEAVVIALNQEGLPAPGVTIEAFSTGKGSFVIPAFSKTDINGAAEFKFRFGHLANDGEINFSANGLTATIKLK